MFLKEVSYQKILKNTDSNIVKCCYNLNFIYFKMEFIFVMKYLIFSIITPVSHDSSEILLICRFAAQETFLILMKTVVLPYICNIEKILQSL